MSERRDPKSTETSEPDAGSIAREPDSDAASVDTLRDIELDEADVEAENDSTIPSPDGSFDDRSSRGNDPEDGGPM